MTVCCGAAAVWIPAASGAVMPRVSELMVGWTLLVASALLIRRAGVLAIMLWVAGLTWIGVGLAPYAGTSAGDMLSRVALVPTALVAVAAILLPRGRPATRFAAVLSALVIVVAAIAGAGWYRYSIASIGVLTLLSAAPRSTLSRYASADRVRLALGCGLTAVGVLGAHKGATTPLFVANLHDFVMIAGATAITWCAKLDTEFTRSGRIDLDEPSALGESLGLALGTGPLQIVFPAENATWLDPSGRQQTSPTTGAALQSDSGATIAWLTPPVHLDPGSVVAVHRMLAAAGEAARLRAALRDRAVEIDQSRERLESAAGDERARIIALLEGGPLAVLSRAHALLASTPTGCTLTQRATVAGRVLGDVVRGLDPVVAAGGLRQALEKLARDSAATCSLPPIVNLGPTEGRVVWFTCAEGLANAAKHACGAAVDVELRRSGPCYELTVHDDGDGGADVSGSGLSGLRDRASSVGGRLVVDSGRGTGTTLRLVVPAPAENRALPRRRYSVNPDSRCRSAGHGGRMKSRHGFVLTVTTVSALACAACGSAPSRSGQPIDPVTLSSETTGAGGVGGDVMIDLVENTATTAVRVAEPKGATYGDDYEGDILKAMQAGQFDISVLRADRLAMAGAKSLAVLQTPFLVTSEQQAAKIAGDPVANDLMAGLGDIGLTGIELVPGGLRHPFGYGSAMYGPADYQGAVINSRYGTGVDAIITALGATPDHSTGDPRSNKAKSGELRGVEGSLMQPGGVDRPAVVTSNVTLYTKFDVVVVRSKVWNGLTSAQRDALRAAVVKAGQDAIAARDTEAGGLDRWCATPGAASVLATPEQVQQLHDALQPVIDAATSADGDMAKRLAALGTGTTPPAGKVCGSLDTVNNTTDTSPSVASGTSSDPYHVTRQGPQDVLDGVWRMKTDRQKYLDLGLPVSDADVNSGIWTITVKDHIATVDQPHGADCTWDFAFNGDSVSIDFGTLGNESCDGHVIGTFKREGDVVTFDFQKEKDYDVAEDNAMFALGMQKIG